MRKRRSVSICRSTPSPPKLPSVLIKMSAMLLLFLFLLSILLGAVNGAPNPRPINNNEVTTSSSCRHPLRNLHQLLVEHFRNGRDRVLCETPDIRDIVVGQGCYYNENAEKLWNSSCGEVDQHFRGGSGLNRVNDNDNFSNPPSRRVDGSSSSRVPPSNDDKRMKKINKLLGKSTCKPRMVLVDVPKDSREDFVHLTPCQVLVKRCGGCCMNDIMECVPTVVVDKSFFVMKMTSHARSSSSNSMGSNSAFARKTVQYHKRCECQCKIRKENCSANQVYDHSTCSCGCSGQPQSCTHTQHWSPVECECVCRHAQSCSTGTVFNTTTCSCK